MSLFRVRSLPERLERVFILLFLGSVMLVALAAKASPSGGVATLGDGLLVEDDTGAIGNLPLEHTDVFASIHGPIARVSVTQRYRNDRTHPIEALYVFPLPSRAAIDAMRLRVGRTSVHAVIDRRARAAQRFVDARRRGALAALLEQERPNIFMQSVTNIQPEDEVSVEIDYVDVLDYVDGEFRFVFPMVVGPRFLPGVALGEEPGEPVLGTDQVGSRISPPILSETTRSGHDISVAVELNAGATLSGLTFPTHQVETVRFGPMQATMRLRQQDSIPNRDFVVRYRTAKPRPELSVLTHRLASNGPLDNRDVGPDDGFVLLVIQPELNPASNRIAPKEMIFVVDESASMAGFPIAKAKNAIHYALENLNPDDRFQVIRFANDAEQLAPDSLTHTPGNLMRAHEYVREMSGSGGTILFRGIRAALDPPVPDGYLRIVSFMTDGYIGNERHILAYIEKHLGGARLFPFGVGSAVNRYLIDKMAQLGKGRPSYILPEDPSEIAVATFYEQIRNPYLTDIELAWEGIEVVGVHPSVIPDLYMNQPLLIVGRYLTPGKGRLRLSGNLAGQPFRGVYDVKLDDEADSQGAIPHLWARARIEELTDRQLNDDSQEIADRIESLALDYRLLSPYTSFVAVHDARPSENRPRPPVPISIPLPLAQGLSHRSFERAQRFDTMRLERTLASIDPSNASELHRYSASGAPPRRNKTSGASLPRASTNRGSRAGARLDVVLNVPQTDYRVAEPAAVVLRTRNTGDTTIRLPSSSRRRVLLELRTTRDDGSLGPLRRFWAMAQLPASPVDLEPSKTVVFKIVLSRQQTASLVSGSYRLRVLELDRLGPVVSRHVEIRIAPAAKPEQ